MIDLSSMDQFETPPYQNSLRKLDTSATRLVRGNTEKALEQNAAVSDFLRNELEKFKKECIKQTLKGRINKWEIWPVHGKEINIEQLREIFQLVVVQFPESRDTFIGRSFPKGSFIELRDPQTSGLSRTLTEFCYIPLEKDVTNCFGHPYIPALQIELKRQSSKESDRDTFGNPPSLDIKPLGIYEVKEQAGISIGDSKTAYESALADNIVISYCMVDPNIFKSRENDLDDPSNPSRKSLNSPDAIMLRQQVVPRSPEIQSDLQLMLKSASASLIL